MKDPKWKQFEIAVAQFVSALDPNAKVTHNAQVPDKHTGKLRQRDVWIETTICDHFPLKVLISCKKYKAKIDQQHMDAFIGELQSSGANKGVLYSYSGFTKPAIEKAKATEISCCTLFRNEPPQLPDNLVFDAYLQTPAVHLRAHILLQSKGQPETYGELLRLALPIGNGEKIALLDYMELKYFEQRQRIRSESRVNGNLPKGWTDRITIKSPEYGENSLIVEFGGDWDVYAATLESYLMNGSYSFTEKVFKGTQSFPDISKNGPHPGKHWKKVGTLPEEITRTALIGTLYGGNVDFKGAFESYRNLEIPRTENA
jgi:hypothetical protein